MCGFLVCVDDDCLSGELAVASLDRNLSDLGALDVLVAGLDLDLLAGAVHSIADNDVLGAALHVNVIHCAGIGVDGHASDWAGADRVERKTSDWADGCCGCDWCSHGCGLRHGKVAHNNLLLDGLTSFICEGDRLNLAAVGCGDCWVKIVRNFLDLAHASLSVTDSDFLCGRGGLLILGVESQVVVIVDLRVDGLSSDWASANRRKGKTSDRANGSIVGNRLVVVHRLRLWSFVAHDNFFLLHMAIIVCDCHNLDLAVGRGVSMHVKVNWNFLDLALFGVSIADGNLLCGGCRSGLVDLGVDGHASEGASADRVER